MPGNPGDGGHLESEAGPILRASHNAPRGKVFDSLRWRPEAATHLSKLIQPGLPCGILNVFAGPIESAANISGCIPGGITRIPGRIFGAVQGAIC
jgi:hypothetical protein